MAKVIDTDQHPATEHVNIITDMDDDLVNMAHQAAEREKAMPFKEALKLFWPGAIWSMCLSLALVMEGYDVGLVRLYNTAHGTYSRADHLAQSLLRSSGLVRAIWNAEPEWVRVVRLGQLAGCTK
jgi:hypothetical protein